MTTPQVPQVPVIPPVDVQVTMTELSQKEQARMDALAKKQGEKARAEVARIKAESDKVKAQADAKIAKAQNKIADAQTRLNEARAKAQAFVDSQNASFKQKSALVQARSEAQPEAPVPAEVVDAFYAELEALVSEDGFTPLNYVRICLNLIAIAEENLSLSGLQKKALVLAVVQRYADKDDGHLLSSFIDLTPALIDNFIAVDKGELKIHASKASVKGCLGILGL